MSDNNTDYTNITFTPEQLQSCAILPFIGEVPAIDADISGIGVLIAFFLSAYLTYAAVLFSYLSGLVDPRLLRPVDTLVHRVPNGIRRDSTRRVIETFVILLSDQQIVVGLAILIAGFVGLAGTINVYHFQIVIYLAWLASSVHLSALTMLSEFFSSHRAVLHWRLVGMTAVMLMLLVSLVPTASNLWAIGNPGDYLGIDPAVLATLPNYEKRVGWGVPAKCYFFKNHGLGVNPDAPMGITLLLISYLWKLGGLFGPSRRTYQRYIRRPVEKRLERMLHRQALKKARNRQGWIRTRYAMTLLSYVWLFSQNELMGSFAASLHLSWIGLIFGTIQIVVPRQQNIDWASQENQWGFGQIVPIVLLVQPVGLILEHWSKRNSRTEEDRSGTEMSDFRHSHRAGDQLRDKPRLPLSEYFETLDLDRAKTLPLPNDLQDHQRALYASRVFQALIIWTELGGAGVCAFTFYWDTTALGDVSTANWFGVVIGIAIVWGAQFLLLLCSIPFSRIYR
ncbi:hypothetical protein K461DRAFT_279726 [Myriangium duriaei CBS 260.36]|uniref:Uncharacterized protein n=1 Tax=Myriangium duriaei CBS 260.36 TaxID=1168546 RepID=A0A9P4MIE7_9PEZI|nr:hypothetical protein K461DRAFT_279726 [Myriangium duriaei CBS 260.36]